MKQGKKEKQKIEKFEIIKDDSEGNPTGFYERHDEDEKYRLFYGTHFVSPCIQYLNKQ
ncbi:MAG TPA: hypothetical protein IAB12_03060 [Candidatus Ornithospirochaeta avicola]|uniref:Uncharacterized protein n=1 Tax=Candidatus Ornithospirochaeta avicola TaxID=2840896 RepID=A0A9D1TMJ3_9SPIO|nr:hypothetical protein [Candidatus Ornithospirochaeta avicola]